MFVEEASHSDLAEFNYLSSRIFCSSLVKRFSLCTRWLSDVCKRSRALFAQCREVERTSYTKHCIRYCQLNQYDFREHCTKYTASQFLQSSDIKVIAWSYEELLCRKVFHYSAWLCCFLERHRCFLSITCVELWAWFQIFDESECLTETLFLSFKLWRWCTKLNDDFLNRKESSSIEEKSLLTRYINEHNWINFLMLSWKNWSLYKEDWKLVCINCEADSTRRVDWVLSINSTLYNKI